MLMNSLEALVGQGDMEKLFVRQKKLFFLEVLFPRARFTVKARGAFLPFEKKFHLPFNLIRALFFAWMASGMLNRLAKSLRKLKGNFVPSGWAREGELLAQYFRWNSTNEKTKLKFLWFSQNAQSDKLNRLKTVAYRWSFNLHKRNFSFACLRHDQTLCSLEARCWALNKLNLPTLRPIERPIKT